MFKKLFIGFVILGFCSFPYLANAGEPAWWTQQKRDCGLPPGLAYNDWDGRCGSPSSTGNSAPTYDNAADTAAAQREQERANAARREEEERQRRAAENQRRLEEAARQAKFLEDRDAAAQTLRGSSGSTVSAGSGLRGSTATSGDIGLRGSGSDADSHGLRKGMTVTPNIDPNVDPMIVDARNVPSGLPKSVDEAIPHTPAGERVRKGFQAVQDGDWQVALAWFKDALNKEPNNAGIARLVDLAEFTYAYRMKPKTPAQQAPATKPANEPPKGIRSNKEFVEDKPVPLENAGASQIAGRKRANAAYKKYVEKFGDRDPIGRTSAMSRAARGEGYTDAELKAQLREALIEYRKEYRKRYPHGMPAEPVGGTPAVEEITIGGKG